MISNDRTFHASVLLVEDPKTNGVYFIFSLQSNMLHESPVNLSLLYRINVTVLYMLNSNM